MYKNNEMCLFEMYHCSMSWKEKTGKKDMEIRLIKSKKEESKRHK